MVKYNKFKSSFSGTYLGLFVVWYLATNSLVVKIFGGLLSIDGCFSCTIFNYNFSYNQKLNNLIKHRLPNRNRMRNIYIGTLSLYEELYCL